MSSNEATSTNKLFEPPLSEWLQVLKREFNFEHPGENLQASNEKKHMRVLVPVEDPFFALCIVDFIKHHKWENHTEFLVINVLDSHLQSETLLPTCLQLLPLASRCMVANALHMVETVSQAIAKAHPGALVQANVFEGDIVSQIKQVASNWQADLMVMGSHGRGGFNHFFFGSVALQVSGEIATPLILIKPNKKTLEACSEFQSSQYTHSSFQSELERIERTGTPSRIIIEIDDNSFSDKIIDFCLEHQWMEHSHFKLLSTIDERLFFWVSKEQTKAAREQLLEERRKKLNSYVQKLQKLIPVRNISTQIEFGSPRKKLLVLSTTWNTDLLIVGNHVREPGKAVLNGATMAALCAAPCSVLLLKEKSTLDFPSQRSKLPATII